MKNFNKYMTKFQKLDGTKIENVAKYIENYIESDKHHEFEIFIGTDSQKVRKRNLVWYSSVVCLYRKGNGAHIIYAKEKRTDIIGIENRLLEEVNYSIQLATYLRDNKVLNLDELLTLHIDISTNKKNKSNKVHKQAEGWVTGMGFECVSKPDSHASSYAADMVCRMN